MAKLDARQWDLLLRLARRALVLPQLAWRAESLLRSEVLPPVIARHFRSALTEVAEVQRSARWELECVLDVWQGNVRPVLLKGLAYLESGLAFANGRVFSDVDVLVPRSELDAAERLLLENGWSTLNHDAYDQRYYRKWMHELPPMQHRDRSMPVDLHHAIMPLTARLHPSSERILAAATKLATHAKARVPAPPDLVLHAAVHLCYDSDFALRLREVIDIDALLRHYDGEEFRLALIERALEQELERPLWYATHLAARFFDNPAAQYVQQASPRKPPFIGRHLMQTLMPPALFPGAPERNNRRAAVSRRLLYIRSHWLRMPPRLLTAHLARKAWRRLRR